MPLPQGQAEPEPEPEPQFVPLPRGQAEPEPHPHSDRTATPQMRFLVLPIAGAFVSLLLVFGTGRPPAVLDVELSPDSIRALVPPPLLAGLQVRATSGAIVLSPGQLPGCAVSVLPVALAGTDAQTTRNFAWTLTLPPSGAAACSTWLGSVLDHARRHDRQLEGIRPGGPAPPRSPFDTVLLALAAALLGAVPVLAGMRLSRLPLPQRRQWLVLMAIALLARALWPHRLTMVFFGYEFFAHAHHLDALPRYGPAATALWSLVLGPIAVDHAAILWLQAGLGAATVATWATWLTRATGQVRAGWLGGAVLALSPLWIRDHVSESMHVGAMACLAVSAIALTRTDAVSTHPLPHRAGPWLAALALGLAGLFRGDVAVLALPTVAVLAWVAKDRSNAHVPLADRKAVWPPVLVALAILAVAAVHGGMRAEADIARGNLPNLGDYLGQLARHLVDDALPWRPDWLPIGVWLPILAWVALGRPHGDSSEPDRDHRWLALLPLAMLWLLPSYLDLNETSLPRLQLPAATLLVIAAAGCAAQLTAGSAHPRRWLALFGASWLVSAAWTLPACLAETNAHAEDDLLRELRGHLPRDRSFLLVTRTYAEGPAEDLHLHQPTYLFQPPGGRGRVVSAQAWLDARAADGQPVEDAWFFRSVRCHAAPLAPGREHPGEHPACVALARIGKPVFERDIPNSPDGPTFHVFGDVNVLRVGLYRLPPP